jgi:hypothetical protein
MKPAFGIKWYPGRDESWGAFLLVSSIALEIFSGVSFRGGCACMTSILIPKVHRIINVFLFFIG